MASYQLNSFFKCGFEEAFEFLAKRLVVSYCTKINRYCYLSRSFCRETTYLFFIANPRGEGLSLSAYTGVGNRPPRNEKMANLGGYARGGW